MNLATVLSNLCKLWGYFLFVGFALSIAEGRSTAGLMFFFFLSFFLYLFVILFENSYIYQFNMMAEPGGICILQSFEYRLTEEENNKPWLYVQR